MKRAILAAPLWGTLALGSMPPAQAADDIVISRPHHNLASKLYVGASFGNARYDKANDSSAAYTLFGGYHLNEVLALDLSYADLGKAEKGSTKAEASAFSLGVLGKLPVKTDLTLFGRLGLSSWSLDWWSPNPLSDSDIDVSYGIGADYDITSGSAMRFGLDYYSLNGAKLDENITMFSIGFIFRP
jgi:hypothetical protein